MSVLPRLQKLLDENEVEYQILHHPEDFRARTTAADTHTPPAEFAKSVFLRVDGAYALAVLPADHFVAPSRLGRSIGADSARLATEFEMGDLCPECEIGASPPFGRLFGLPTHASPALTRDETITFNGGSHRDAVRMSWADYLRIEDPNVTPLSRHEEERA
jgi:Ala-tRNA(Pro) deacylase